MSYTLRISPVRNAGVLSQHFAPIDVSERLLGIDRIVEGIDRNDYEYGVATIGNCNLTLFNGDGLFDESGESPDSLFPAGRDGAIVELLITPPGETTARRIFYGAIRDSETRQTLTDSKIQILVASASDLMRTRVVQPATLQENTTLEDALLRLVDFVPLLSQDRSGIDFTGAPDVRIGDPSFLVGRNVWDAVRSICQAGGRVFYLEEGANVRIVPYFHTTTDATLDLASPIKIKVATGASRVRNEVEVEYREKIPPRVIIEDGRERILQDPSVERVAAQTQQRSVEQFRANKLSVSANWINTESQANAVATNLATQHALPRRILIADTFLTPSQVADVKLLRKARVHQRESYTSEEASALGAPVGSKYAIIAKRGIDFTGRIIRYAFRLEAGGVRAELTLEETT